MIEPTMTELTTEIPDNLPTKKIIYAEYAPPGAMGNEGGVMIYVIMDDTLTCYESNIRKNENVYTKAVDILEKNGITTRNNHTINKSGIFKFYGGGMGNNVFINKNVSLVIAADCFIYTKNKKVYKIYSSVQGVFLRVAVAIRRDKRPKIRLKNKHYIDEKKQKEKLQKKLDKKIIAGKTYTEKEINAILKTCCISQDYVSFRRDLIDNGYLHRTNDCKAYWRNVNK